MKVTVYGPLRGATGKKTVAVEFNGGTVREALSAFADDYPRAERHLFENGTLQSGVRVAVEDESVDPDDDCPADATLSIHPAMRGG